jgi:transcriptional regulator with XRE-family HTH domain
MYEIRMPSIRDSILRAMRQKGWRNADLARHSGIPESLIWKYLNPMTAGKSRRPFIPKIGNLQKLATALELSVDQILGDHAASVEESQPEYRRAPSPPEIVIPIDVYHQLSAALKALLGSARVRDPVMRKRRKP